MPEGYMTIEAPVRYCLGCDHHRSQMIHSGRDPLHEHFCKHPKMHGSPHGVFQRGTFGFFWCGREIEDREGRTPTWCPAGPRKEGP